MRKADPFYKQSGLYGNLSSLKKKNNPAHFIVQLSIILSIPDSLYTEDVRYILETET